MKLWILLTCTLGLLACSSDEDDAPVTLQCEPGTLTLSGTVDDEPVSSENAAYVVATSQVDSEQSWSVSVATDEPPAVLALDVKDGALRGVYQANQRVFESGAGSKVVSGSHPGQVRFSLRNMGYPFGGNCQQGATCPPGYDCMPDGSCCDTKGACLGAGSGSLDGCLGASP